MDHSTKKQSYTTKAEANRANAAHSTGPKTEEGKRIASHNALKTGLTGRTVLLPTDDLGQYQAQHERQVAKLTALLDTRGKAEAELKIEAAAYYQALEKAGQPFPLADLQSLGFEISLDALRRKLASDQAYKDGSVRSLQGESATGKVESHRRGGAISSAMADRTRQGFLALKTLSGMSLVTTLPAPMMVREPIRTPGRFRRMETARG